MIWLAGCAAGSTPTATLLAKEAPTLSKATSEGLKPATAEGAETQSGMPLTTPESSSPATALPETAIPTEAEGTPLSPSEVETLIFCAPTQMDALGPFYTPGAPIRDKVGEGYVLTGVVRSAQDCSPIPGAQIDVWMAGPDGVYRDDYRAVLFSAADGSYRFESHFPPPYTGRPPHIHLLVNAPGFATLVTQHYPRLGESQAAFNLVLQADS